MASVPSASTLARNAAPATQCDSGRRRLLAGLALASLAPVVFAPGAHAAAAPHDTLDFDWIDPDRGRAVPTRLYWPGTARAEGAVPLVVFSHGIGGSRMGYSYLGRHWAANGYASLHVQHVGSDRSLWAGNPFSLVGRLHAAATEREAIDRAKDVRFALDRLLDPDTARGDALAARIDRKRIVAAGHSYGANTTLLVIGARIERSGALLDFRDARFSAAIAISAPPFYGEPSTQAILSRVRVPTLHVTSTEDTIRIPGYYSGASDRIALFEAIPDPRKTLVVFEGGSHSMFTDRAGTGGAELNPKVKLATRELSLAFFRHAFNADSSGLAHWAERWQPIVARLTPAGRGTLPSALETTPS